LQKRTQWETCVSIGTEGHGRRADYLAYGLIALGVVTSVLWVLALGWVASIIVPLLATALGGLL
jgi:hypothetical protein